MLEELFIGQSNTLLSGENITFLRAGLSTVYSLSGVLKS